MFASTAHRTEAAVQMAAMRVAHRDELKSTKAKHDTEVAALRQQLIDARATFDQRLAELDDLRLSRETTLQSQLTAERDETSRLRSLLAAQESRIARCDAFLVALRGLF
jgi:hypothetical protein